MLTDQQLALEYLQQFIDAYAKPMLVLKNMVDGLRDHGNSRSTFNRHGDWEIEYDGYVDIEKSNYDWLDNNLHNIMAPFDAFEDLVVKVLKENEQSPLKKLLANSDFQYLFESSEWQDAETPDGTIGDLWAEASEPGAQQAAGWEYEDDEYNHYEAYYDAGGHSTDLDIALPYIYKRWQAALAAIETAKRDYEKELNMSKAMRAAHPLVKAAQRKGFRVKADNGYEIGETEAEANVREAIRSNSFEPVKEIYENYRTDYLQSLERMNKLMGPFLPGGEVEGFLVLAENMAGYARTLRQQKNAEVLQSVGMTDADYQAFTNMYRIADDMTGHIRNFTNAGE